MLPLDDPRWKFYTGGYQNFYDASDALRRLLKEGAGSGALQELGEELCHQGDLGTASYASLPWLVEYVRRCPELDSQVLGLILTIEFGRPFNRHELPLEIRTGYERAIRDLPEVVLSKRCSSWTDSQMHLAAAVLAMAEGNPWFARTYYELDRAMLDHLLTEEFGTAEWDWP